jgi:hypothetical protein
MFSYVFVSYVFSFHMFFVELELNDLRGHMLPIHLTEFFILNNGNGNDNGNTLT